MELFRGNYDADLGIKGADTLKVLARGERSSVTHILDMDPPIDSGLERDSSFGEKLTRATDAGNVIDNRGSKW